MNAISISDHGTLSGHLQFRDACQKHGIKPIFGVEAYFMEDVSSIERSNVRIEEIKKEQKNLTTKKQDKQKLQGLLEEAKEAKKVAKDYFHLILLAKNYEGYQNLVKIQNAGVLDGFYGKPRIDWAVLEKYKGGLIASSACLGGILCKDIENHQLEKAKNDIARFKQIFGDDDFYLELQLHDIKQQIIANKALLQLAEQTNTQYNITLDSHYVEPQQAYTRGLVYSLSRKIKDKKPEEVKKEIIISEENENGESEIDDTGDYNDGVLTSLYLKNTSMLLESWQKWMSDVPLKYLKIAIENTRKMEQKVERFNFDTSIKFPAFETHGLSQNEFLKKEVYKGLAKKGLDKNPKYLERIKRELRTIEKLGFASYFNVVGDLINHAKEFQSIGNSRGSAGSSLISYLIGITDLDPLKYDLFFERFLDEGKSITNPTFGIENITKIAINHQELLSTCSCNQKH